MFETQKTQNAPKTESPLLFELGKVIILPEAQAALEKGEESLKHLLEQFQSGNWGYMGEEGKLQNDKALNEGKELLGVYKLEAGKEIWIRTNPDRSETKVADDSEAVARF